MIHKTAEVSKKAKIGEGSKIWNDVQVREEAEIGKNCIIGKNAYIDWGVKIGDNVKIGNNVSIFNGATIEDGVQISPHVCFTNDRNPRAINPDGSLKTGGTKASDWEVGKILIKKGASIGAGSVLLPNITIGEFAMVGAGSVVTKDVPDYGLVYGNRAELKGYVCKCARKLEKKKDYYFCDTCNFKLKVKDGM